MVISWGPPVSFLSRFHQWPQAWCSLGVSIPPSPAPSLPSPVSFTSIWLFIHYKLFSFEDVIFAFLSQWRSKWRRFHRWFPAALCGPGPWSNRIHFNLPLSQISSERASGRVLGLVMDSCYLKTKIIDRRFFSRVPALVTRGLDAGMWEAQKSPASILKWNRAFGKPFWGLKWKIPGHSSAGLCHAIFFSSNFCHDGFSAGRNAEIFTLSSHDPSSRREFHEEQLFFKVVRLVCVGRCTSPYIYWFKARSPQYWK